MRRTNRLHHHTHHSIDTPIDVSGERNVDDVILQLRRKTRCVFGPRIVFESLYSVTLPVMGATLVLMVTVYTICSKQGDFYSCLKYYISIPLSTTITITTRLTIQTKGFDQLQGVHQILVPGVELSGDTPTDTQMPPKEDSMQVEYSI